MEEKRYLKKQNYLSYGLGAFGQCFIYIFANFLLIFLTDTIGMNVGIIGTLMMISKLLDGISDVLFGTLLDKTNSKMGKARPWIFWTAIPLGISQLLLFFVPVKAGVLQYVYFFIVYTLLNAVFYTANAVAYNSLSVMITKNTVERVKMGVTNTIAALIGSVLISSVTVGMVQAFGGGLTGWRIVASIYTVLLIAFEIICACGVKEVNDKEEKADGENDTDLSFLNGIKYLLRNKYYLLMLAYYIIYYISSGVLGAVGTYYCIHVLKQEALLGVMSAAAMMPTILGVVFAPILVKKFGMYKSNTVTLLLSALSCIVLVIGGYTDGVVLVVLGLVLKSFFSGPISGSLNVIIAEISNYQLLRDGIRLEGRMYSCVSMGVKLGTGIASAFSGWLLSFAHYDGTLAVQSQSAIDMIRFLYIMVPSICTVFLLIIMKKLNIWKAVEQLKAKEKCENGQ
ncbi:MAG: MFS transporter [Lachnospiraceae bacterium]|nr:MFS transporter [Lachnospiraceae bacterium]